MSDPLLTTVEEVWSAMVRMSRKRRVSIVELHPGHEVVRFAVQLSPEHLLGEGSITMVCADGTITVSHGGIKLARVVKKGQ